MQDIGGGYGNSSNARFKIEATDDANIYDINDCDIVITSQDRTPILFPVTQHHLIYIDTTATIDSSRISIYPEAEVYFSGNGKIVLNSGDSIKLIGRDTTCIEVHEALFSGKDLDLPSSSKIFNLSPNSKVTGKHARFESLPTVFETVNGKITLDSVEFHSCANVFEVKGYNYQDNDHFEQRYLHEFEHLLSRMRSTRSGRMW